MGKKFCPLINGECREHQCEWYVQIQGTDPQTGVPVSQFDCTMKWLPLLIIEAAQQARQAGAATESMRNELVQRADAAAQTQQQAIDFIAGRLLHAPRQDALPPGAG